MNADANLFPTVLLALTVNVGAQPVAPENAIRAIEAAFPSCEIHSSSVGPLYAKNTRDVAASLICKVDSLPSSALVAGPYALAIVSEQKNGEYRLVYKTSGLLSYFGAEIKHGSLFLRAGFPGTGGGQTATSYDYQFRLRGRSLMLIGMTVNVEYIGNEEPTKDQQYRVSVNYLTGIAKDSRTEPKSKKLKQRRKVALEEFTFEPDGY